MSMEKAKVTVSLTKKQARGLKKLAQIWRLSSEDALKRLLNKVIEESL